MDSLMRFVGGPKDGEEHPARDGWPAPDGCRYPLDDGSGRRASYVRTDTVEAGGSVVHVYQYEGEQING